MSNDQLCIERIVSHDGRVRLEVIERGDGIYSLRRFEKKFDPENDAHYEVRCLPDPVGLFADVEIAVTEATRIIEL